MDWVRLTEKASIGIQSMCVFLCGMCLVHTLYVVIVGHHCVLYIILYIYIYDYGRPLVLGFSESVLYINTLVVLEICQDLLR